MECRDWAGRRTCPSHPVYEIEISSILAGTPLSYPRQFSVSLEHWFGAKTPGRYDACSGLSPPSLGTRGMNLSGKHPSRLRRGEQKSYFRHLLRMNSRSRWANLHIQAGRERIPFPISETGCPLASLRHVVEMRSGI